MDRNDAGYIYIMQNSHMPGLVKIGFTKRTPIQRAKELYRQNTSVPGYFWVKFQKFVYSPELIEKTVHEKLTSHRVNEYREFFEMGVEDAKKAILQVINELDAACDPKDFYTSRKRQTIESSIPENPANYEIGFFDRVKNFFSAVSYYLLLGIGFVFLSGAFLIQLVKALFGLGILLGIIQGIISFFVTKETSMYTGYAFSALWIIGSVFFAIDETKKVLR